MLKQLSIALLLLNTTITAQEITYRDPAPHARGEEVEEVIQALQKLNKGHVLLTGKNGTDFRSVIEEIKGNIQFTQKELGKDVYIITELNPSDLPEFSMGPTALETTIRNAYKMDRPTLIIINNAQDVSPKALAPLQAHLEKDFGSSSKSKSNAPIRVLMTADAAGARKIMTKDSFGRLFTKLSLHELSKEESLKAIQINADRKWRRHHPQYQGITDEALEYVSHYYHLEQSGIARPTAMKELIEGAIVLKSRTSAAGKKFHIDVEDIREYIKKKTKLELMPGSKNFDSKFEKKWAEFGKVYGGDTGLKIQIKEALYRFLSRTQKKKMESWVLHGAPGGGKTYLGETLSKEFFQGAILKISGAELKNPADMTKLIGSPPGYIGSEQQRSMLTKFISENPSGGVIVIEEADYMHRDIVQFFTNMKSDMAFNDGLGKKWDISSYILVQNTNIGQEAIIPVNSKNSMTWDQYEMMVSQLTEVIEVDGKEVRIVKQSALSNMQEQYIEQIVLGSNPNVDTSQVAQEANKQKRRDKHFFVMSPNKENLLEVAKIQIDKLAKELMLDQKVTLSVSKRSLRKLLMVEKYDFFKGYSYVAEQLEKNITSHLSSLPLRENDKLTIKVVDGNIEFVRNDYLIDKKVSLSTQTKSSNNPWRSSEKMKSLIKNLAKNMTVNLKGSQREIDATKELLNKALVKHDTRKVISLIGTTGNGKTQYAKALAVALYQDKSAMFKITGLNTPGDLNSYFRPAAGFVGSNKETEFEQWFKSRQKAGGGVILFDELLSYAGLNSHQLGEKVAVFNELYELLDEGKIKIAGKIYDASSFIVVLTGNSLQEEFASLPGGLDGEKMAKEIAQDITKQQIIEYFGKLGIDAPKVARMGRVIVKGPLPQAVAKEIVISQTNSELKNLIKESGYDIKLKVDPELLQVLSEKLPTSNLGFRNVEQGLEKALVSPLTGILADMPNIKEVEVSINGKDINWKVNGEKVVLVSETIEGSSTLDLSWKKASETSAKAENKTPNLETILPKFKKNEALNVEIVSIHEAEGHWRTDFQLSGENGADFVSMIPGGDYLGYVRPKNRNRIMNLSEIMRELVVLEAGHRSVILRGIHAPGAGIGGKRKEGGRYNDDVSKINRNIETLISNKIFPEYSELSSEKFKDLFRLTVQDVVREMADYLIIKGNEMGITDELMEKLKKDTYLTGEYLDEYVKKAKEKYSLNPYEEMKSAVDHAYKVLEKKQSPLNRVANYISPGQRMKLLKEIRAKLHEDVNSAQNFCDKNFL